ncbi:PAS domain-containing sensor histidine kinase [Sunxiuqinia sp. A32]|uniref:PAS domain-containing sensor histidine kinase n=1 Tax=Sunxiuqinia sp. A32 TaxID=3461496 RepID=UPI004045E9C3
MAGENERIKSLEEEVEKLTRKLQEANELLDRQKSSSTNSAFKGELLDADHPLNTMIQNLRGMVYRCKYDRDWTMEFISNGIKELTGYPPSDFINNHKRSFSSIIHPEHREHVWSNWQIALVNQEYFEDEYKIITSEGDIKWVWENGCGIFENGRLLALEGLIIDITDFRNTINELKEKEELLKLIGNVAKISGWELDVATGNVRWTSDVGAFRGINSHEEIDFQTGIDLHVLEDQVEVKEAIKRAIEAGVPYEMDVKIESSLGLKNWLRTKGLPVYENGNIVSLRGIFQDITERKEALLRLEDERLRLKTLVSTIPDMIWLKDLNGVYIGCNPRFESFFGAPESEIVGKTDYDFVAKDLANFFRQKDAEAIAANEPRTNHEWVTYASDGHQEYLETIKTPMYDSEGKLIGVLGISRDITTKHKAENELLKAKEKAEESDKLKTAFLQNMSHEIRTPMNAIMGFSELLPEVFDDKEQLKYFTEIINSRCDDLLQIIDGLLDIAKIESGQISVFFEKCDLATWFADLKAFFQEYKRSLKKDQVELKFGCLPNEREVIYFDQVKVKQILVNLVNNAFKFTEKGSIEVSCEFLKDSYLMFTVADTGLGIKREDQNRIFERFLQVKSSTSKPMGGTGLGLAIVRGILSSMGGKIWVESEYGNGATFHFTVPYATKPVRQ